MKRLSDFEKQIHKCSKCGLCQAECPVYQVTGNDCTVSRGQFVMLKAVLDGDLKEFIVAKLKQDKLTKEV